MEGALVSAAAGALKPVLGKLATMLGDECKRFGRVRKEIGFLTRELAAMEAFLLKKSMEEEDPDIQDKVWMKEVRELSYDIEDSLDDFLENSDDKTAKPGGFMKKIKNLLDKTKDRRKIAKAIEELKNQVIETSERHKRYTTSEATSKVNNLTVDPRALAIFEDVSNLVGIDGPKNELIQLLTQENICESRQQQQPKIISIVGSGGLGKTTLACQVYKELKMQFDCHAFVSVSRNPDMMKILRTILSEIGGYSSIEDIPHLITQISNFLADKRYFIVVDDIWNVEIWDIIKFAFPLNDYNCRIITTTRVNNVAQSCRSSFSGHIYDMDPLSTLHARQLFHRRLFNSEECPSHLQTVSCQILEKCAGLPLAIIAISGLLANKEKTKDQWHKVESSIGRGLERNSTIESMIKIIALSYFDLPHHLKTCLLYLSIFPEDYIIEKEMLIRRWIAEGFIQKIHGYTLYEAGEMCFNELINRSLIQPQLGFYHFDEATSCRVHDTVLDFIVSKSIEENFVTIIGVPGIQPDLQSKVRRLSLQNKGEIPVGLILSAVRSLNIFGCDVNIPSLSEFKHLRVLCFENGPKLEDHHLADIGNWLRLKCLRFNTGNITKFAEEIAKLRYLETLDIGCIRNFGEASVPLTIPLGGRLVHLVGNVCSIPNDIKGIEGLEVMRTIYVDHRSVNCFQRLGDLSNLRKLNLCVHLSDQRKLELQDTSYKAEGELSCSIHKLVKANLRSLLIILVGGSDIFLDKLKLPAECSLEELGLWGKPIRKIPRWIGSLVNLQKLNLLLSSLSEEDVEILGGLPNLRYIEVHYYGPSTQLKAAMEVLIAAHPNHPRLVWSG